ncbi:hypothetical protein QN277_009189 [Acacia crassicarpa]|uniref:Uncharacterized protein n=1 Tax=Acacia crassicarpa TaxID=499986 RepID=A0AAE1ISF6_9FABA|nr:hypothetical protein QN277_009189 [Acacia crassicarpa]
MKTISGKPISEKPISLSKAAKILSKFISVENGASHVVNAYLHRASSSFSELNQLHKELKLPCSDRKHKRSRSKTCNDTEKIEDNSIDFSVHQFGSKNPGEDAETLSQTIVKFNQEPDEATEYDAGTAGGSEKLKKKKKHNIKLQEKGDHGVRIEEVEADHKLPLTEVVNEHEEKPTHGGLDFSQEPVEREKRKKKKKHEDDYSKHVIAEVKVEEGSDKGNAVDDKEGLEEGKKHKKEKKKKKDKDIMNNFSDKEGVGIKPEDEIASRKEEWKEIIGNGVEDRNGGSVDLKELPNKKKKRHMAGSEDTINTDEDFRENSLCKSECMEE